MYNILTALDLLLEFFKTLLSCPRFEISCLQITPTPLQNVTDSTFFHFRLKVTAIGPVKKPHNSLTWRTTCTRVCKHKIEKNPGTYTISMHRCTGLLHVKQPLCILYMTFSRPSAIPKASCSYPIPMSSQIQHAYYDSRKNKKFSTARTVDYTDKLRISVPNSLHTSRILARDHPSKQCLQLESLGQHSVVRPK